MLISSALTAIASILLIAFVVFLYGYIRATVLPRNNPQKFISLGIPSGKKIVVCAGDSITHGRVSANYVDILEQRLAGKGFAFVNAGVNSELSWNLLQRLDDIIACKPDYITILIGTNDANGMISEFIRKRQKREMKLPQEPNEKWFEENLQKICEMLQKNTSAKIALLSLPPIGEELVSIPVKKSKRLSEIIQNVAQHYHLAYLPLHERLVEKIQEAKMRPKVQYTDGRQGVMYIAIAKRFLLGKSFNKISKQNGFLFLTDLLHLNENGAGVIADLVEHFIMENNNTY